jgi:hypothetical protein
MKGKIVNMSSLSNTPVTSRHTLSSVLGLVFVVGVLATLFFPTIVGHVREGDVPAAPDLDAAPILQQSHFSPAGRYAIRNRLVAYSAWLDERPYGA